MSLNKVKIIDTNFAHAKYSTDFQKSKFIQWERNYHQAGKISFVTDRSMFNAFGKNRIGWIMEPPSVSADVYSFARGNSGKFKTILTYDRELLESGGNFRFYPHSGCWIKPQDFEIYEKSLGTSIIASAKRLTDGHLLRHSVIDNLRGSIDCYGRGYNPIEYKLEALKKYRYSITIENCKKDYYFTEKLIDCFVTGTIPIYYGCPSIGDFFNTEGMLIVDNVGQIKEALSFANEDYYKGRKEAIEENFNRAKEFLIAEDWIFTNYQDLFLD